MENAENAVDCQTLETIKQTCSDRLESIRWPYAVGPAETILQAVRGLLLLSNPDRIDHDNLEQPIVWRIVGLTTWTAIRDALETDVYAGEFVGRALAIAHHRIAWVAQKLENCKSEEDVEDVARLLASQNHIVID